MEHAIWLSKGKALPDRLADRPYVTPEGTVISARVYLKKKKCDDSNERLGKEVNLPPVVLTYKEPSAEAAEGEWDRKNLGRDSKSASSGRTSSSIHGHSPVRVNSVVFEGCRVKDVDEDSALAILTSKRASRFAAMSALSESLEKFVIRGVDVTLPLLRSLIRDKG